MRNRLLQLLNDNRARRPGAAPKTRAVRAAGAGEATVYLYDIIVGSDIEAEFWGGVSPQAFAEQLGELDVGTIHLRINSPGGDVFAARAIEQALRQHKARVVVHIDGLAASAASFIAMAGDEVRISAGAMIMIHKAWTIGFGNADDFDDTAALLEKIDGTLADTYAKRTGMPRDELLAMMADETWFTGAEAVDAKFADRLADDDEQDDSAAQARAPWNLSAFDKAPSNESVEKIVKAEIAKALAARADAEVAAPAYPTYEQARARANLLARKSA